MKISKTATFTFFPALLITNSLFGAASDNKPAPTLMGPAPSLQEIIVEQYTKIFQNNIAASGLKIDSEEDLLKAIDNDPSLPDITFGIDEHEQPVTLKSYIFVNITREKAKDAYLSRGVDMHMHNMPERLRPYFTGVSIYDILKRNGLKPSCYEMLQGINLSGLSSLDGLNLIEKKLSVKYLGFNGYINQIAQNTFEGFANVETVHLGWNQITEIAPGAFAGLTQLEKLYLFFNPIVQNSSERARIEEEVRIATNGRGKVRWTFDNEPLSN